MNSLQTSSESDNFIHKQTKKAETKTHDVKQEPKTCTVIRLPKQSNEQLSLEEKQYVSENVGKLDLKASEGIREIVQTYVSADDNGNMDFELEALPYEVGKTLYRFIKAQMRRL